MILFFNIENLDKESAGDPRRFLQLIYNLYHKKPLISTRKHRAPKLPLVGNSFILDIESLFRENTDLEYLVQYIRLAARRDYLLYKAYGEVTLPLSFFPDIDIAKIRHNPLIKITEDKIFFKHEKQRK